MSDGRHESQPDQPTRRQVVKFTLFKVDQDWRRLAPGERERAKQEFCEAVEEFGNRILVRSYTLMGMRGDADFLLWQVSERLDDVQELTTKLFSTAMGPYLTTPYSYLAMTRRSVYVSPQEEAKESRLAVQPSDARYLFVYPFVKTRPWYKLTKSARQGIMDEHIAIGRKYPSVKLNTTYSFGLDDQEFVVAFETDEAADFLDLVMELRETESSMYTLRDTPIFTGIAMSVRETLDSLGAPGDAAAQPQPQQQSANGAGWARVAAMDEVPAGSTKVVYAHGEQVAIFNVNGRLYAIGDRCSHANGSLADGSVDDDVVTCPYHDSQFELKSGQPVRAPAAKPVPTFQVRVDDGAIFVAPQAAEARAAR